ncbi:unnamed protein product [Arabis nemorensis]|uniref:Endonuclease/exonuclease/phosphatase domain-containing protein n=1 Tax=Arabis nemorensis TaxID=586526 RepID=A0A565CFC6_9BRAS|nr:unnamed protein product [Arabis nemorensis]
MLKKEAKELTWNFKESSMQIRRGKETAAKELDRDGNLVFWGGMKMRKGDKRFVFNQIVLLRSGLLKKERRLLWSELESLASSPQFSCTPWTILGDFNAFLFPSEHSSVNQSPSRSSMREFKYCVDKCALSDLPYCGNTFTWTNKQCKWIVAKKLDRIMVNDAWFASFPESIDVFGEHLEFLIIALAVFFLMRKSQNKKRPFKFFSLLNRHPEFIEVIKCCWDSLNFLGSKMLCISKKLKELKSVIRTFCRDNFTDLEKRVAESFSPLL